MGWSDALIDLGISYDSEEAIGLGERVMKFINDESRAESARLATQRGMFPNRKGSAYDPQSQHFRGTPHQVRNCARTTIAPTGTISNAAGCSSGIEPLFAIAYQRFQAEAVDAIQRGEKPDPQFVYVMFDPRFEAVAKGNDYFGIGQEVLEQRVIAAGSIQGIEEILRAIRRQFVTAADINHRAHIDHQVAFQRSTDNAVSKTINMPKTATIADVTDAYLYAFDQGVKGLTVYRDGAKVAQVLNIGPVGGNGASVGQRLNLEDGVPAICYEMETGAGRMYVTFTHNPNGTLRPMVDLTPKGTEAWALAQILGIAMSKAFEHGYDPKRMIRHLNAIKANTPIGLGDRKVESVGHGIGKLMKKALVRLGFLPAEPKNRTLDARVEDSPDTSLEGNGGAHAVSGAVSGAYASGNRMAALGLVGTDTCPECYATLQHGEGCSKCSAGCGYSTCG